MCLGVPGRILQIHDIKPPAATVEVKGVIRNVSLGLLPADEQVAVGDYVLVYLGMAMNRITAEEAAETKEMLEGFGEAYLEEATTREQARELTR
ncbi:MAG: HypC/HybG/HupF family hydrogenase formation chaperone [Candidatus Dormibacteraceae bacterium]